MNLSDDQKMVLEDSTVIVTAGPGAGKTRAIVERYTERVRCSAKSVALISFTNTAVDEIVRRTASDSVHPLSFVGTFDRFLHRFIVTPHVLRVSGAKPRFVDSWSDVGGDEGPRLRVYKVVGGGVPLSDFVVGVDGRLSLSRSLSRTGEIYIRQVEKAGHDSSRLISQAESMRNSFLSKHLYDCDHARLLALKILEGEIESSIGARLALRFSEIVIDEFQDCSEIEYRIRDSLIALGINVVVVADPDQGIYEFRNAIPRLFAELVAESQSGAVVNLDENFRSSQVICSVVSSLRCLSGGTLSTARNFGDRLVPDCVFLLVGSPEFVRKSFCGLLDEFEIERGESVVLAPKKKEAAELAGRKLESGVSWYGRTGKLLSLLADLRSSSAANNGLGAMNDFSKLYLSLFDWVSINESDATKGDKLELLGIDPAQLRLSLSSLLRQSATWGSRAEARASIHHTFESLTSGSLVALRSSISSMLPQPRERDWARWRSRIASGDAAFLRHSHIHGVKGLEFDGVLLYLPSSGVNGEDSGLASWVDDNESEARRVLYVGASRAERLLAFSINANKVDKLKSVLDRDGVRYRILTE